MNPIDADERIRRRNGHPEPSLVGWRIVTDPNTPLAEDWTIYADIPAGIIDEVRVLYLRSDKSGEVISCDLKALEQSEIHSVISGCSLSTSINTLQ
jgi:hypothetical protein